VIKYVNAEAQYPNTLNLTHMDFSITTQYFLAYCSTYINLPDAVKYVSVWEDSDVKIGLDDVVELAVLLVPEKGVRHPNFARIGHRQVFDSA